jgi:hypothetical protein
VQLEKIQRYETQPQRLIFRAMAQLERWQRMRKGETLPAPLAVVSDRPRNCFFAKRTHLQAFLQNGYGLRPEGFISPPRPFGIWPVSRTNDIDQRRHEHASGMNFGGV